LVTPDGAAGEATKATPATPATAELSLRTAPEPLSVTFVAKSTGFSAPVVSYLWKFGDGTSTTTSKPEVVHAYPTTGRFAPEVTESTDAGEQASAPGVVELFDCAAGPTCVEELSQVDGVKTWQASGPTSPGAAATVDLFVGPYRISNCQTSVGTDGALTDSGFSGDLTVKVVYQVATSTSGSTTCFASVVPFRDAQGQTVTSGALPKCSVAVAVPPCVKSVSTTTTASGSEVTKVLVIPPGDPKVGAL
jgi:PKD repeat protein